MEPQHMMKFPTSQQKVNKPSTLPDGIQLTARQFLGENPEMLNRSHNQAKKLIQFDSFNHNTVNTRQNK